jgi:hypothetical protein
MPSSLKAENQLLPVQSDAQRLITYRLSGLHMTHTTVTKSHPHEMPIITYWVALAGLRQDACMCTCTRMCTSRDAHAFNRATTSIGRKNGRDSARHGIGTKGSGTALKRTASALQSGVGAQVRKTKHFPYSGPVVWDKYTQNALSSDNELMLLKYPLGGHALFNNFLLALVPPTVALLDDLLLVLWVGHVTEGTVVLEVGDLISITCTNHQARLRAS